jgi:hypothetical protein
MMTEGDLHANFCRPFIVQKVRFNIKYDCDYSLDSTIISL